MDPNMLFDPIGLANNFAMGGIPMHLARVLLMEGKCLAKELFIEVIVKKNTYCDRTY